MTMQVNPDQAVDQLPEVDPTLLAETLASLPQRLESIYQMIYEERMQDIPIVNDDLNVHAIGFQVWENSFLGVMITPWFMNLMLLPGPAEDWSEMQELSTQSHIFPSGKYSFNVGYEPELGYYQTCSLFSPMFEFADDAAAVETATVVIDELMNSENVAETDIDSEKIERLWNGEATEEEVNEVLAARAELEPKEATSSEVPEPAMPEEERPTLSEKINQPMSRRNLIRGSFLKDGDA